MKETRSSVFMNLDKSNKHVRQRWPLSLKKVYKKDGFFFHSFIFLHHLYDENNNPNIMNWHIWLDCRIYSMGPWRHTEFINKSPINSYMFLHHRKSTVIEVKVHFLSFSKHFLFLTQYRRYIPITLANLNLSFRDSFPKIESHHSYFFIVSFDCVYTFHTAHYAIKIKEWHSWKNKEDMRNLPILSCNLTMNFSMIKKALTQTSYPRSYCC